VRGDEKEEGGKREKVCVGQRIPNKNNPGHVGNGRTHDRGAANHGGWGRLIKDLGHDRSRDRREEGSVWRNTISIVVSGEADGPQISWRAGNTEEADHILESWGCPWVPRDKGGKVVMRSGNLPTDEKWPIKLAGQISRVN